MGKPSLIINDENMSALTKFIGKQVNINRNILDYLKTIASKDDINYSFISELERSYKEQESIQWLLRSQ